MAAPKINRVIMAVKIFGAADGFLPSAWIAAIPPAAMIAQGPRMASAKIRTNAVSRFKGQRSTMATRRLRPTFTIPRAIEISRLSMEISPVRRRPSKGL